MSGHGLCAASAVDQGELSNRRRRCLTAHPLALLLPLAVMLFLIAASKASATSSFYWYGEGGSTCWQTGQLGAPSDACSNVGAGYLSTPGGHTGGLAYMSEGGLGTDLTLSSSGDYCSYYRVGDQLTSQDSTNEGILSGLTMPTPYSSYQEGDKTSGAWNACQADGSYWGQAVRGPSGKGCSETCGIHHYVSFRSQKTNDQPWSSEFGSPSLVLSANAGINTFTHAGTNYLAWGYVCPELEDTEPSFNGVIEYCFQEWRAANNIVVRPEWKNERATECGGAGYAQVQTYFWPGTSLSTEISGSTNTFEVGATGSGHFEAKITEANLIKAARAINSNCAGWHLSENASNYALVGVEQGLEGENGVDSLGGWVSNLQLHTEYTPLPPEATTNAASSVQEEEATLNGSVNPKGTDTHYYFQYGETTSYGSSTAEGDAGSGTSSVAKSNTIGELQPGMTYHYRLVATSSGGTIYGGDQMFTAPSPPAAIFDPSGNGNLYVATEGSNHALYVTVYSGGTWSAYQETASGSVYSAPATSSDEAGDIFWTYEGREHKFEVLVRVPEKEGHPAKVEGPYQEAAAGNTYSAPATSIDSSGNIFWTYEGREHKFEVLVRVPEKEGHPAKVEGPYQEAAAGNTYSAPSSGKDSTGSLYWTYEGREHKFEVLVRVPEREGHPAKVEGPYQEAAAGNTYSAPTTSTMDSKGNFYWFFAGANNTLDLLERLAIGEVSAMQRIGGEGTTS
jgi:hypothetical protein